MVLTKSIPGELPQGMPTSDSLDLGLLFNDMPVPTNVHAQGMYSSWISNLAASAMQDIAYPDKNIRPPLEELTKMQERDPVVSQSISFKSLRAVQSFGKYTHPKKDIENLINGNLYTLDKSFNRTLYKLISSVIHYGIGVAEYTLTSKARGFKGQWRLANINVLDPERIKSFKGKEGKILYIEYDNGDGKIVLIPYSKCLHITNNAGAAFNERQVWGIGDGLSALNYYKLKKVVLTQLALAAKNNSTGIVHARVPNVGKTVLVDSKMKPIKGDNGAPVQVTKQIALNYQLQDLYRKDYIVTDIDVDIKRIQVQNNENFWEYVLSYIDRSIQRAYGIPVGIFDSGSGGLQNSGLGQNFKTVFDSTIYALTSLLKEELINKIIRKLLAYNFPQSWWKDNYGEFSFEPEEDQGTINSRLSTVSSLIASGILDQNDPEIITLIKKNLGLPALTEEEKEEKVSKAMNTKIQEEIQNQLQVMQLQQQMQMMQQPPAPPTGEPEATDTGDGGEFPAEA